MTPDIREEQLQIVRFWLYQAQKQTHWCGYDST